MTSDRSPADRPQIEIRDVHKYYNTFHALKGVSLEVKPGEVSVLIGPSGCGKSTLLRSINLLDIPTAGHMRFEDRQFTFSGDKLPASSAEMCQHRMHVGMVFQHFHLFPHYTALQNVMSGPRIVQGKSVAEAKEIAMEMLAKVKLAEKADLYPRNLSGGQAQRVAIARSLAMRPRAMLFDEVTSALDPELVDEVLEVMKQLAREGTTMIVVTHEMNFASEVADSVYFMDSGSIVASGTAAQILDNPENPRLHSFLKRFRSHRSAA
jgi:ABC-type polar amino acid transport system ATPase subunit